MCNRRLRPLVLTALFLLISAASSHAQHAPPHGPTVEAGEGSEMWMTTLPGGWHLMGMGHVYPAITFSAPFRSESPLNRTEVDLPHAALMANLESPGARWVLRAMFNFEGLTLAGGELTPGGWGEGFIDARHPHTLLHEAMLSYNWWDAPGGALSLSAGRGFAPYGTQDPMYRPALKYPTNHHLSQLLERWTTNLTYLSDTGIGLELGIFDGTEPEGPWDMGNFENFGNSWSGRLSYRFGGARAAAPWELATSYGRVRETHGAHEELTTLYNVALRHEAIHDFGSLYALAEASRSDPAEGEGFFSLLGESQVTLGGRGQHRPFYRIEYATRPEYERDTGAAPGFFRYDHDAHAVGATRWLIQTLGYSYGLSGLPLNARPFIEAAHNRVRHERGTNVIAEGLFGAESFWSFAGGVRIFLGGGPMRMGTYGVLDPMTQMGQLEETLNRPAHPGHAVHPHHPDEERVPESRPARRPGTPNHSAGH